MSPEKKQSYLNIFTKTTEQKAEEFMRQKNTDYRAGKPSIPDTQYDEMMEVCAELFPDNAFFNQEDVESDLGAIEGKTVKLPARMLSTNKAYSLDKIAKWADDVVAVGKSLGMRESEILFRVTPKLDGYAAFDDGKRLYTRGDGRSGTDITRAFERGMLVSDFAERGLGPGEIVVNKVYFEENLSSKYENSRNIIAAAIKEGELDEEILLAIKYCAIAFAPFSRLSCWTKSKSDLVEDIEEIWEAAATGYYDTDGLVIEAVNENIKSHMGSTNHHHRWQIAYKKNTEHHNIKVTGIQWQTSKNGRLTPVVLLEPTKVSGVTISKATGHHFGNIVDKGIWKGAIVQVCRSGLVIPYISKVIKSVDLDEEEYPGACPSCGAATEIDDDNMLCTNETDCPAQIERTIEFFFKTLGNCDGFGPKVIEKLCKEAEVSRVAHVYTLSRRDFERAGLGEKTAGNLFNEIQSSTMRRIEDWRFLAAFSIHNVGKGGCEKLLKHHRLEDVFKLSVNDIVKIDGFAEKMAKSLVESLQRIKPQFDALRPRFDLEITPLVSEQPKMSSPIFGHVLVFTGTMKSGKRDDMEKRAKALGAKVSSSVSKNTDYLICGENVGESKTNAAKENGTRILSEQEYLDLVA